MGLNRLLKWCVFTAARQYNDVPYFGYALALEIMLKDHNYVERWFSIFKQKVLDRVHDILTLLISRMAPWTLHSTPNLSPSSPQNCRLIVVDAKERATSLLYKSKVANPVDNVPVFDVCLLLHGEHYYVLNSPLTCFGRSYYCMECEKHLITRISTSENHNTLVACVRKWFACTSHPTQDSVKNVLVLFRNSTYFNNHKQNGVCARATSCKKCGHWFAGPISNHICKLLL